MGELSRYPGWNGTEGFDPQTWFDDGPDAIVNSDWPIKDIDPRDYLGPSDARLYFGGESGLIPLLDKRPPTPTDPATFNTLGVGLDNSIMHAMGGHS